MRFQCNKEEFQKHFKKGDYVVSYFDTRKCYFIVGDVFIRNDGNRLSVIAPYGIDAKGKVKVNDRFGIENNNICHMSPEEIETFNRRIREYNANQPDADVCVAMAKNITKIIDAIGGHDGIAKILHFDCEVYNSTELDDALYIGAYDEGLQVYFASGHFKSWESLSHNAKLLLYTIILQMYFKTHPIGL